MVIKLREGFSSSFVSRAWFVTPSIRSFVMFEVANQNVCIGVVAMGQLADVGDSVRRDPAQRLDDEREGAKGEHVVVRRRHRCHLGPGSCEGGANTIP